MTPENNETAKVLATGLSNDNRKMENDFKLDMQQVLIFCG